MKQGTSDILLLLDRAETSRSQGLFEQAQLFCNEVLQQDVNNLEAFFLLATINYMQHDWEKAVKLYQRACRISPELAFLRINLGLALQESGRHEEALVALDEAEQLGEKTVNLYYNRGVLLQGLERIDEARANFEQALALDPKHINSWVNLTAVCLATGDTNGALRCCRHGLYFEPFNVALLANLATAYGNLFRLEEALACYQRVVELTEQEERSELLGRMANCLSDLGLVDQAITCFEQAIESSGDFFQKRALASTRLFVLHYSSQWSAAAIAAEHKAWGKQYFQPHPVKCFTNNRDPDRPLRVAYLSPDLKIHAVVFFLQPVLAAHDSSQVTVYCYSDVKKPDAVTRQLKEQHAVIWRDCSDMDDMPLQQLIQQDQIDILIDLAGHTALNRLSLFAERVAPIQVSWIGYPNTTGLEEMDYRISDAWADPPGMTEHLHTEQLIRLPDSFLCYRPGGDFPDVGPLPCQVNGYITFGSFSNFKKVTPVMLELWAQILAAVPYSRLVFRARGLSSERFIRDISPLFIRHQVAPERITVLGHARSVVENLEGYHVIDIALDTFPYHGTTTTCESLCMGVPVVSMAGDSHVSRVGVSLLHSVGLSEFVADSPERYCAIAVSLAGDISRLITLRGSLRERLLASPLADNVTFTRSLEAVYRKLWLHWCRENRR